MAIRFDAGKLRKPEVTPEGFLRAEAIFARDGILEYRDSSGAIRRELRTPEENKKALTSFGLKPFTIEHPPVLVNSSNAKDHVIGVTDSTVVYDRGGFVKGVVTVFDSDAVNSITSKRTPEVSVGYICTVRHEPGEWNGQRYDAIQENIQVNHVCATVRGRAGEDVRIHLDSLDDPDVAFQVRADDDADELEPIKHSRKRRMASLTIDGVVYDSVPETVASVVGFKLKELEKLQSNQDSLTQKVDSLSDITADRDRQMGRADELERILYTADSLLRDRGIVRGDDGNYYHEDKKGKMPPQDEEEMMEEDDGMEEEMEEEPPKKGKGKKTMMDSADDLSVRADSVSDRLRAWKDAEALVPGISESEKFDDALDVVGIQRLVLNELKPQFNADSRSADAIEAAYDLLKDAQSERQDAAPSPVLGLQQVISMAQAGGANPLEQASAAQSAALASAWQQPLSLSR